MPSLVSASCRLEGRILRTLNGSKRPLSIDELVIVTRKSHKLVNKCLRDLLASGAIAADYVRYDLDKEMLGYESYGTPQVMAEQ